MKVKVDKSKCIGCGVCIALAPKYFKFGADGKSEPIQEEVPDDAEEVRRAAESCPTGAITLE